MQLDSYPSIEGVHFSTDDREFLADQSDKVELLKGLVILLAGASTGMALLSTNIKSGRDLAEYLVDRGVDIATPNWGDASKSILQIQFSVALRDVQYHLEGVYSVNGRTLTAPKGKAKAFFKQLAKYYTDVRGEL